MTHISLKAYRTDGGMADASFKVTLPTGTYVELDSPAELDDNAGVFIIEAKSNKGELFNGWDDGNHENPRGIALGPGDSADLGVHFAARMGTTNTGKIPEGDAELTPVEEPKPQ